MQVDWDILHTMVTKQLQQGGEAGHDSSHIIRVVNKALRIYEHTWPSIYTEKQEEIKELVILLGWLHEMGDRKFQEKQTISVDEILCLISPYLRQNEERRREIVKLVSSISFSQAYQLQGIDRIAETQLPLIDNLTTSFDEKAVAVVSDADRLEATGAVGIARLYCYCGTKNLLLFEDSNKAKYNLSFQEYKENKPTSGINHFLEKVIFLPNYIRTEYARELAYLGNETVLLYLDAIAEETGISYPHKFLQHAAPILYRDKVYHLGSEWRGKNITDATHYFNTESRRQYYYRHK